MGREPWALYILRFLLMALIGGLLVLVYWSSLLVEDDLRTVKEELQTISGKMESRPVVAQKLEAKESAPVEKSLPNLLSEDPFYEKVLPGLLPKGFQPHGVRKTATVGKPDNLHPFSNWLQVSIWTGMCVPSASRNHFGIFETMAPDLAVRMEQKDDPQEYWIYLRKGVFWQPLKQEWFPQDVKLAPMFLQKQPVTAHDFKFYFDALMNPSVSEAGAVAARTFFSDIEEIRVIDPLTFVVRWKAKEMPDGKKEIKYVSKQLSGSLRPLPCHIYCYFANGKKIVEDDQDKDIYRKSSIWAANFSQHWAKNVIPSCGPWLFDGMSDRLIQFKRNPEHYFPLDVLTLREEVEIKSSPDAIWQEFKQGILDNYNIRPTQLLELKTFLESPEYAQQKGKDNEIKRLDYISRSYQYVGWNMARPLFSSRRVRQALTMAIDRQRIIRQNLNGMGIEINGSFYRYSPSYDESIPFYPFDPEQAKEILAQEGWYDSDGDGILDKEVEGKKIPFEFSLTYFVKNPASKAIAEFIQSGFQTIGIKMNLHGVDIADITHIFEDKNFDALFLGWSLGSPPEDPRQLWHSSGAKEKGSSNAVGFANKEADKIIDQLDFERDPEKRIELYHAFDKILHEEVPYTFLYTPKEALLYRSILRNVFLPIDRQDLIPHANVAEPDLGVSWMRKDQK